MIKRKDSTDSKLIINNKPIVVYLLIAVTCIILIGFLDYYLLPKIKTEDNIDYYIERTGRNRNGRSKNVVSYNYFTKKDNTFATKNFLIEEDEIELEYSLLLKSVTKVKSKDEDYSKYLVNGLNTNGILLYCCLVLLLSIGISLKILLSKKVFSENAFYNIICLNSFLIMVCLYVIYLF